MLLLFFLTVSIFSFTISDQSLDSMYCDIEAKTCNSVQEYIRNKFIFYDVNPPEGFNLRRDVYMRFAIFAAEARNSGKKLHLVLPPWYNLYHWQSKSKPLPWSAFFDVNSLKSFAPVLELHEVFSETKGNELKIDTLYVLKNYDDPFENGEFIDKWEIDDINCNYKPKFWGYKNISAKETICVRFQGKISLLNELIYLHPGDKKIMFAHGEIPLHDNYGSVIFWNCRKSMKFNKKLVDIATNYINNNLNCFEDKCPNYLSVHWRRKDFAYGRKDFVPSIDGTVKQINNIMKKKLLNINQIFIATDAEILEFQLLEKKLKALGYKVHRFIDGKKDNLNEGSIAIVDQIICSRAYYFIGTHDSTFSFRIQEEREILGFRSDKTFNRLCPDTGKCETASQWNIVQ